MSCVACQVHYNRFWSILQGKLKNDSQTDNLLSNKSENLKKYEKILKKVYFLSQRTFYYR
ncbi:MAG TPA: hypothetical protein DCZ91_23480 [Lachnospiraceae bacterium]|nr:hypothetical protein [Lachnospiraceae bacterium]